MRMNQKSNMMFFLLFSLFLSVVAQSSLLGKWYQIADIPQFYENEFRYCTTAFYENLMDNQLLITNSARNEPSPSAETCTVYGNGVAVSPRVWNIMLWNNPCVSPVSAVVPKFNATLTWIFVSNEMAIGSGGPQSLYVLSRTPMVNNQLINNLMALDSRLVPTVQQGCWS